MNAPTQAFAARKAKLVADIRSNNSPVGLAKDTSNLFRDRKQQGKRHLDVRAFNHVLEVNVEQGWVDVEGMTPYDVLVEQTLKHGVMPAVVPQLKSITIGGAVSGIGIESTSFRFGLPHESVTRMDVMLASGDVIECSPDNEHADLFFGIPNSYGTLGYILKLEAETLPVKPYVALEHIRFSDIDAYFQAVAEACRGDADFVDGSIFSGEEMYLTLGRFRDEVPYTSDHTWLKMYFQSIREREQDFLSVHDYLWRWDTDWFWCSKNLYVQNLPMRLLLGRKRLNSISYQKVMRWNNRIGLMAGINRLLDRQPESVIQDVDIPIENAPAFLRFFLEEIGITPVWMCPIGGHDTSRDYPLYPLNGAGLFINFGFWDIVPNREKHEEGYFNRAVENKVLELGGVKSLYSDAFYEEEQFWQLYNGPVYDALKRKYDPDGRFRNLYEKCVLRQ